MLENVMNYDKDVPKGKSNWAAFKWSTLFFLDSLFSLTRQKGSNNQQLRKVDNDSWIGRKFKAIHEANVKSLLKQNAEHTYDAPLVLPSIDAKHFDKAFFDYWKKKVNMPLVIKGYLKEAQIIEEANPDSLIKLSGEKKIKCLSGFTNETSSVGQNMKLETATLEEFLSSEKYKGYYINNFYGILNDQDFLEKCHGKEIDEIQGQNNFLTQWFISRSTGSGTTIHCAAGDNMFLNIKGRKEWFFVDRTYTPVLQPSLSKYAIYAVSELHENLENDFYGSMTRDYPFLKHIPFYNCVLEEGDMLFNPPFWWHSVRNITDYTVGCATRYWATKEAANSLAFTLSILFDAFKHPTKSSIPTTLRMKMRSKNKSGYIDSIFSKKD